MDHRVPLPPGSELTFPGMTCVIARCIGRGSNAIVYEADYPDATSSRLKHHVLLKELFPFDPHGLVKREKDLSVCRGPDREDFWQTHLTSFQRGNDIHLQLLALYPDLVGGNINTFPLNNTLYTILEEPGSRSLKTELGGEPAPNVRRAALWCLQLLDCLEVFHRQNYLHLDISLDNILLIGEGKRERLMLTDYNSVHSRTEIWNGEANCFSTREGFMASEIQTGMYGDVSFCTDLFSAAAVFYATLTGSPPAVTDLYRKNPPDALESPLLAETAPAVREQVKKILRRGLCVMPDKRYPSCACMREDLDELVARLDRQDADPIAAPEAEQEKAAFRIQTGQEDVKNTRKKQIRIAAAAAAILLCTAGFLIGRHLFPTVPDGLRIEQGAITIPAGSPNPDDPFYEQFIETRDAAERGDPFSLFGMGVIYEDGLGVKQDYMLARQYYMLAAEKNQPNAVFRIGILYQHGLGTDVSMSKAAEYYQKAADLGLTEAMLWLGELHLDGGQLVQSDRLAFGYFQIAWDAGDPQGACRLGDLYREGRGTKRSLDMAAELYQKAADAGWGPAAEALGDLYSDENSGMMNPEEAMKYYQLALDLGQDQAAEKLNALRPD